MNLFCLTFLLHTHFPHRALHLIHLILYLISSRHCPCFGCALFVTIRFVYLLSLEWWWLAMWLSLYRTLYRVCQWSIHFLVKMIILNLNCLSMLPSNLRHHLLYFGWVHYRWYFNGLLILAADTGCWVFYCGVCLLILSILLLQLLNLNH